MSKAATSQICKTSLIGSITGMFSLLDYHEFWWPDQILKVFLSVEKLNRDVNMAYAYCDFSQAYSVLSNLVSGFNINWLPSNIENTYKDTTKINFTIEDGQVVVQSPRV